MIKGTDHAIWRRSKLIPFNVIIPDAEQDKKLPEKLRAEWPGILAWGVRGCLEWREDGLPVPDCVRAATETYRSEMDELGDFLETHCRVWPNEQVATKDLYAAYISWCGELDLELVSKNKIAAKLRSHGFAPIRIGTAQERGWKGLGQLEQRSWRNGNGLAQEHV